MGQMEFEKYCWNTVAELKAMCREQGLPDSGSKKELIDRLMATSRFTFKRMPKGKVFPAKPGFTIARKG